MRRSKVIILFACLLATAHHATAQDFPNRPLRFIVPFPPGGGTDLMARVIGRKLSERWGQPVIMDNRAGGDGIIGLQLLSKAAPDGYALAVIILTHAVQPSLKSRLPYDLAQDFAPVIYFANTALVLVTHALSITSIRDLIALAKAKPGQLNFAGAGTGGAAHLGGELFNYLANVKMTHIPYKGTGPAIVDLAGGHVDLMFSGIAGAMPHLQSGKLRALAVTGSKRSPSLPELPTIAESGVKDYEVVAWYGVVVRSGTPRPVVDKLYSEIYSIIRTQEVTKLFADQGAQVVGLGPGEFSAFLASEIRKWSQVVKQAGIPVDAQ